MFLPLTSEACEKSSQCVSTGVRQPENTCGFLTTMIMALAVKSSVKPQ